MCHADGKYVVNHALLLCHADMATLRQSRERLQRPRRPDKRPPHESILAALAQLVEHIIRNDGVTGSSPVSGTTAY